MGLKLKQQKKKTKYKDGRDKFWEIYMGQLWNIRSNEQQPCGEPEKLSDIKMVRINWAGYL